MVHNPRTVQRRSVSTATQPSMMLHDAPTSRVLRVLRRCDQTLTVSSIRATSEDQEHPAAELIAVSPPHQGNETAGAEAEAKGWVSSSPKLPVKLEATLSAPAIVSSVELEWMFGGAQDFDLLFTTVEEPHKEVRVSGIQHELPYKCRQHCVWIVVLIVMHV